VWAVTARQQQEGTDWRRAAARPGAKVGAKRKANGAAGKPVSNSAKKAAKDGTNSKDKGAAAAAPAPAPAPASPPAPPAPMLTAPTFWALPTAFMVAPRDASLAPWKPGEGLGPQTKSMVIAARMRR